MHAFDLDTLAGRRDPDSARRDGRDDHDARRRRAEARAGHARHRRRATAPRRSPASWAAPTSEVSAATRAVAFESAYFKPASVRRTSKRLGPEDRSVVAVRARRRHQRAGRGAAARDGADGADRRRPAARRRSSIAIRRRASPRRCTCGASGWRRCSALQVPDAEVERILRGLGLTVGAAADGWDVDRADLPRRSAARSRSHRGSRPALRLRQARADVPVDDRAGAAARPAHRRATSWCGGC